MTTLSRLRAALSDVLPDAGFPYLLDEVMRVLDEQAPELAARDRVEQLIEASSLGTEAAKAARESVPLEIGIAIATAAKHLARAEVAQNALQRIQALHPPHTEQTGTVVCSTCLLVYPCPTVSATGGV